MNFSNQEIIDSIVSNASKQQFHQDIIELIKDNITKYDGNNVDVLRIIKEEFKYETGAISCDDFIKKMQKTSIGFIFESENSQHNDSKSHESVAINVAEKESLMKSSDRKPLTQQEAERRLETYGKNRIDAENQVKWYIMLMYAIIHPFNILLMSLAIVSIATQDYATFTIMVIMVILSTGLRFVQEIRSESAAIALKNMVKNKACVIRIVDNVESAIEIPMEDIVPGDYIKICAGDMVPGDIVLIESKDLFISQSSLTGESIPVEKFASKLISENLEHAENPQNAENTENPHSLDNPNVCFLGSNVVSGVGKGVVVKTGKGTIFGEMAKKLGDNTTPTTFQRGIKTVSFMFLGVMAVIIPFVFVISGIVGHVWMNSFLFSISVAVGLTPEMLPMIVNGNLAKSAISMSRKKCIVKKMESIINFGSMDVLCTDKTGTLTQDKVALIKYINIEGDNDDEVLTMAFLNSYYQTGLKNLLDVAVIDRYKETKPNNNVADMYTVIDEIPFDFVRRRMSVVVRYVASNNEDSLHEILISKGAVDEMLQVCTHIKRPNGGVEELSKGVLQNVKIMADTLCQDGLRVIAVATRHFENGQTEIKEQNLTLLGYIAFLDPPKDTAAVAIKQLMEKGVEVKVLTGDSPIICNNVCRQVNLPVKGIITSSDLNNVDDLALSDIAEKNTIFAKLTPLQKQKIVQVLRKKYCVGFLGDGINDAAALKEADVGISVDSGTDIAKENADIILLEKSLLVLVKGVIEGRKTYGNTIKYIKMAVSSNFGNVFSILVACAWLPFLPMKPLQILIQNLLYDFSQIAIPWDHVDAAFVAKPRTWNARSILKFMACIGPISSIFDMTTFSFMWFYFGIQTPEDNVSLFQTAWFVEGLITQTFIVHMIRTEQIPFFQSIASIQLLFGTFCTVCVGIALPFIPVINTVLGMKPLPGIYFAYLLGVMLGYGVFVQIGKTIFIKVFHTWM